MTAQHDPIIYFFGEHEKMDSRLSELQASFCDAREKRDKARLMESLRSLLELKTELKRHFKEEEKALFPSLEPYIIKEGGAFMIMEHPGLMAAFNELASMVEGGFPPDDLYHGGLALINLLRDHSERENAILQKLASVEAPALKEEVLKQLSALRLAP